MRYKKCLIVGGGGLVLGVLSKLSAKDVFVIALREAHVDLNFLEHRGFAYKVISVAKVGEVLDAVKRSGAAEVCFFGTLKKPKFSTLRPDIRGFLLLFRILRLKNKGDDAVLRTIIGYIEERGVKVVGVDELEPKLVAQAGVMTKRKPTGAELESITLGFKVLDGLSPYDIGQGVAVEGGVIVGVEALEGTDALIKRCGALREGCVLVKSPKVGQTLKIDMPTIGVETIKNLAEAKFAGLAIKAGSTLVVGMEECVRMAELRGLFIICV